MKTIVIGDIHGCYSELKNLITDLESNGEYNKNTDKLVFLGDYIDRGKDSSLVIKFIRKLQKENKNVIALMGNHEDMLLEYYKNGDETWLWNGGKETLESYYGLGEQFKDDMRWMENLPLYHTDNNFIYVHGGIDVNKPLEKQDKDTLLWIRDEFIYNKKKYDKRVVFGHTPTILLNKEYLPILTNADNIDIDTACVFGGSLTALIIENDEVKDFYQCKSNNKIIR